MKAMTAKESNADQLAKVEIMKMNNKMFPLAHAKALEQEKEENREKAKAAAEKGSKLSFYEKYNAYDSALEAIKKAARAGHKTNTEFDVITMPDLAQSHQNNEADQTSNQAHQIQSLGVTKLDITSSRKRTVTYWGQGSQYDKEEIFVCSKVERLMTGSETSEAIDVQTEQVLKYMQKTLKAILDAEEKALPQKQVKGVD